MLSSIGRRHPMRTRGLLVANGSLQSSSCLVVKGRRMRSPLTFSSSSSSSTSKGTSSPKIQMSLKSSPPSSWPSTLLLSSGELLSMSGRVVLACGILYVFQEYGFRFIMCEGPSMMPTIRPNGEIILVECLSHRIWGLEGGDVGSERAKAGGSLLQRKRRLETLHNERQKWRGSQLQSDNKPKETRDTNAKSSTKPPPLESPKKAPDSHPHKPHFLRQVFTVVSSGVSVGDVVILQHPQREGTVCKRVIGLPGDIVIRNSSSRTSVSRWNHGHPSKHVVPDGHVWVEGDNTTNSADSRSYGAVPASLISGRVLFRLWPLRGNATICRSTRPPPQPGAAFTGSFVVHAGTDGSVDHTSGTLGVNNKQNN